MTARQESILNMYRAIVKFCVDNLLIVATNPAFNAAYTLFDSKVSAILDASTNQELKIKGKTTSKASKKKALCETALNIADIVFAYAVETGDEDMQAQTKFTFSELKRQKDDILGQVVSNIYTIASANLLALAPAGVTAATLTDFQTIINNYTTSVPGPKNARSERQSSGISMKKLFVETDAVLRKRMDKLVSVFADTNPDFVTTYKVTRRIDDPAFRKKKVKKVSKTA